MENGQKTLTLVIFQGVFSKTVKEYFQSTIFNFNLMHA